MRRPSRALARACFFEPEEAPGFVRLQRLCVRLLHDPDLVTRLHERPEPVLEEAGIPEELRASLLRNDPRVWTIDPLRPARALRVLMEEFKASTALALLETGELAFLSAFFSSEAFHACVQHRGYMALAFRFWLQEACASGRLHLPQTRAVLRLEGAFAWSRRAVKEARRGAWPPASWETVERAGSERGGVLLVARPGVQAVSLPRGTIEIVQHLESWLFEASLNPALTLCRDAPRPEPLPEVGDTASAWLLEPGELPHVDLSELEEVWAAILRACQDPCSKRLLARRAAGTGLGADELWEKAEALQEAGLLERALPWEAEREGPAR